MSMLDKAPPQTALRPPGDVMRLRRMGAAFPTRLSFLPTLLRWLAAEGTSVDRPVWEIDRAGLGHAVYTVGLGGHRYSLVAVSNDLPPEMRTDRVIAEAWDTAYVLYDGVPDAGEIARICVEAPKQEAGRFTDRELVLSRANKSVRLFGHVTEALRTGADLDEALIRATGYLMRTTAVYGNGKFGVADRERIMDRPGLSGPFMAEMLTVWLIRGFTHDLAEHVGGSALPRHIKRYLGIGNATGLGMAPFLVSHPLLLDAWMQVRETALARVRAVEFLTPDRIERLYTLLERSARYLAEWQVPDAIAENRIARIRAEWPEVAACMTPEYMRAANPIDRLIRASTRWSVDTQEMIVALVLEPFGDLIDGLTDCMATPFEAEIDPSMPLERLRNIISDHAAWASKPDFGTEAATAQFWYVSEEKLEPRLGRRHSEPGAELESPLDIARRIQALARDLEGVDGLTADFLARHPEHRFVVRRLQALPAASLRRDSRESDRRGLPADRHAAVQACFLWCYKIRS